MEPQEDAIKRTASLLERILLETQATDYIIYLGGDDNFRYKIYPEYKANRLNKPKPTWLQDVREFLVTHHKAQIVNGIEADDALGIAQTDDTVIVSTDKDLLQIPGKHYNFSKLEWSLIDDLTGLKNFYQQLIQGDQSDNIPGYDGKMRPKVPKFLEPSIRYLWSIQHEKHMFEHVLNMYNGDRETLKRNAQLLYIHRKEGDAWVSPDEKLN